MTKKKEAKSDGKIETSLQVGDVLLGAISTTGIIKSCNLKADCEDMHFEGFSFPGKDLAKVKNLIRNKRKVRFYIVPELEERTPDLPRL